MLKFIVFAICLIVSPSLGLIESLYQSQNDCYSGCRSTFSMSSSKIFACQSGCNYKLQDENCVDQCRLISVEEQMQASCIVGCSMNKVNIHDRSHRIAIVRIHTSMNDDPIKLSREQIDEKTKPILQSVSDRIKKILELTKNLHPFTATDDSDCQDSMKHFVALRSKWNELVHKQSKVAIGFFLGLCILSSVMLWFMIASLCRHQPTSQILSIRAHELAFDNHYEKEKIQPNEYYYETTPMKIKLTNI